MVVSPPTSHDARLLYIRAGALVALGNAAAAGEGAFLSPYRSCRRSFVKTLTRCGADYALLAALNPDALRQESQRLRTKLTGMIELAEECVPPSLLHSHR